MINRRKYFFRKMDAKLDPTPIKCDSVDTDFVENQIVEDETTNANDEKNPRGTTPAPELTSFSDALNSIDIDENDMKDIELYEDEATEIASPKANHGKMNDSAEYLQTPDEQKFGLTPKKRQDSSPISSTDELPKQTITNSNLGKTVMIHSKDETTEETFERLKQACTDNSLCYKDIVDSLFNTLVGGPFDLESRYIIKSSENINRMLELIDCCPINIQAEIWSIFVAIVKKSFLNLETASKARLISRILVHLSGTDSMIADLIIQLLTVLTTYSISVKELKLLLRALKAENGNWKRNSIRLLDVMQEMTKRDGPDVFFSFPGEASAGISIPPLNRWPHQNGWTFSTWFRNDPKNSVNFEREKPYLFSFSTLKNVGYFCYFMGNALVLRCCLRPNGKEIVKCIKHEFLPRKWCHIVLSFVYSRWAKGEIFCYIDGCLVETIEANWLVSTNDPFGRCFLGCGSELDESGAYSGQMGAIYVFSQSITPQQAACFHFLGPSYQSQFKHDAESNLPAEYKKLLFDGKLNESLVFAYCPKDCHGQLILSHLSTSTKSPNNYFVQVPHAIMKNGVCVITKHSIHNSLHSVGGIQILLPLFTQIDLEQNSSSTVDICTKLLSMIGTLLSTSTIAQQQFIQCQGFSVISSQILRSNKNHFSMNLLETFISISKSLVNFSNGIPLLKQLIESCFFAFHLWVRSDSAVQLRLFDFLANEFFSNSNICQIVRRTQTVLILMNTLKKYYSLTPTTEVKSTSEYSVNPQLDRSNILRIRAYILQLVDYFMFNIPTDCDEKEINRNEEFQCILNFISTVQEDDNLYDVLTQLMRQIAEHPAILVPAFDKKRAICVIFSLVSSSNELIRIPALKIFGYYLCRSTQKRKNESINNRNLFYLLTDKLMLNNRSLTLATYNALYEILTEQICQEILFVRNEESTAEENTRFENPQLLKVIAQLLSQSEESPELLRVKQAFLQDVIKLCKDSRENRRLILQMSVWQEWLISLSYIFPQNEEQSQISELVSQLFSILLFHAIRLEYGGWRVWVDTLAISHSKVSWQIYRRENFARNKKSQNINDEMAENEQSISAALYRTPEFIWSKIQIKFLSDLLDLIRSVIQEWKDSSSMTEQLNNSDNQVFISNTIHILSQLTDSLVMACGGLLPLLAAATAPNSELDIFDTTQQELSISDAASFLDYFAELADTFIFSSAVNLGELEQEKNMPAGGILRQSLRLVSTVAVRNILTSICENGRPFDSTTSKFEAIHNFIKDKIISPECKEHLLQSLDLQRLKGVIYRDMEETKQAQFLALAVIYFISVLMVSRYRDILEPPTTPSPFFDSKTNGSIRKETERKKDEKMRIGTSNGGQNALKEEDNESMEEEMQQSQKKEESNKDYDEEENVGISSIKLTDSPNEKSTKEQSDENIYEPEHLSRFNTINLAQSSAENSIERRQYLTEKLKNSIEPVIPLFREILSDFRPFLQKTLLGTHGQEIMNDPKVMQTLKNGGVIEVVMLLCSQEWQTSLQKHAGLAFIELVNEGRLMAHATRDHILRVSNEADFILNRLRAEDVSKHAQFESETNEQFSNRRAEIQLTEQLIISSRRREFISATKLLDKLGNLLTTNPTGAWYSESNNKEIYTKLDIWEDDSRRKRRFVYNPYGQKHSITSQVKPSQSIQEDGLEEMLKDLAHKMVSVNSQTKAMQELIEESEIEKWLKEESSEIFEQREDQPTFSTNAKLIAPGIAVPGILTLTATDLYFDADEEHPNFKQNHQSLRHCDILHCRWNFQEIRAIFLRRYLLEYSALELFLASRTAIMFALPNTDVVKTVVSILPPCGIGIKYGLPQSRKSSLMTPWQIYKHSNMPQKWQQREISNFDYLMFLNTIAGRTYNDLNQYPIFPWILSNYSSENLDLNDASNFRDLSKPVGALSETRRKHFQDRFNNWADNEVPAFHYGTHYSTHAFTLNWLFRIEPFTSYFLELNGRFDHSNRLFHSISETWEHCLTDTHDVKELIPELFYLSEMFYNLNGYDLGKREDGSAVGDVVLPPWAKNAEEFVKIHRRALESDLVSCQLNQWIDLIFGYKQRGAEAIRATNVFYYLTYEGAVNLQSIENAALRESIQEQILNFGQTPAQLLTEPHPPRHSIMSSNPLMFKPSPDDLCMLMKFISNSPVVHITANTFQQIENPTIITITQNLVFALNRWNPNYNQQQKQTQGVPFENEKSSSNAMDSPLSPSELPITVDPLLAVGNPSQKLPKRHLGDPFDQRLNVNSSNFVCTVDSKYIVACGYPDYSFRVIETENAQVRQVIFGHGDIVTCLARSESTLFADCYIASGSADCTVVLWHFSQSLGAIAGEYNAPGESPNPRVILTGHEATISAITISAEHGLVISGAKDGTVLIHTTLGDLLRNIAPFDDFDGQLPITNILTNRDCQIAVFYGQQNICTFTTIGKQLSRPSHKSQEKILCAILSRDGEFMVVGTECGRISILRLFPLQKVYTFAQTDSPIRSVAISTNQKLIFGGLDSGAIVVFNVDFNRFDISRIRQK